jgi:hypothetical protein
MPNREVTTLTGFSEYVGENSLKNGGINVLAAGPNPWSKRVHKQ